MKKGMTLLVYDEELKRFSRHNLVEDSAEIQKAYLSFKEDKLPRPWNIVILCDKDENVVLSFCLLSIYREFRKQKKVFKTRKYLGYLARHKVKLGCFAIRDEKSFSNFVLTLLQKVELYLWERDSLGKKVAKQNFKSAIQQLYEFACIHSDFEADSEKENQTVKHYQISQEEIKPQTFINTKWQEKTKKVQTEFASECHNLYMDSVRKALQSRKKYLEVIRTEFELGLIRIQDDLIQKELDELPAETKTSEKLQYKNELLLYMNPKNVQAYWLWQSFLMARDTYPKAHKGLDDIISEEELYHEVTYPLYAARDAEVKYFMHTCNLTTDEVFERIVDKCYYKKNNVELFDEENFKTLVTRRVYRGYRNLLKREDFVNKYHEIMCGTYQKYLNPAWRKRIWE